VNRIKSCQGAWLYCLVDAATVSFPAVGAAGVVAAAPVAKRAGWAARLVAESAGGTDGASYFGVSSASATLPKPPSPAGGVRLSFEPEVGIVAGVDVKTAAARLQWNVRVDAPAGQEVTLRWPDLSELPADRTAALTDSATGERVSLRTSHGYTFAMGTSGTRRLLLEVTPRTAADMLAVTSVMAREAPGRHYLIDFVTSRAAAVQVQVRNIAGRPVRQLAAGRQVAAGATSLAWDLTDDAGGHLPSGRYLVHITARTEDGQQASAITSLAAGR
jgi:hypothetical protein